MSNVQGATSQPDQAAAVQQLASIPDLDGSQIGGVLLVTEDSEGEHDMAQLQPTEKATPGLLAIGQKAIRYYRDCEVLDYDAATTCVGKQVMWMSLPDIPLLDSIVNESADMANIDPFDPRRTKLSSARLTAIRVEAEPGPVVLIQALQASQVVAQSSKFGVMVKRGVIDVPKGDLLLLNESVTAITSGGLIFFSNRSAFQKVFDLLEEIRKRAEETLRDVTADLSIDGFDQLLAAVTSQSQMLGKMASIQSKIAKYPKYKEAITMPKLIAFIQTHPECKVPISGEGADAKLVFQPDTQHRFKILKLLDDDYLHSELTSLEYESNSKSPPLGG
jgi:Kiwa KwaB-like protein